VTRASTFPSTRSFAGRSADVPSERTMPASTIADYSKRLQECPVIRQPPGSTYWQTQTCISTARVEVAIDMMNGRELSASRAWARKAGEIDPALEQLWLVAYFEAALQLGQEVTL